MARKAAPVSVVKNGLPMPAANALVLKSACLGDGRQDARRHVHVLQHALHGERIHHGGQHAHGVRLGALHAFCCPCHTAEYVAAADHKADLGPGFAGFLDGLCKFFAGRDVDTELAGTHEGFP